METGTSNMELEANPLELSLDELIALNKSKNRAKEEEDLKSMRNYAATHKSHRFIPKRFNNGGIHGLLTHQAHNINTRLRNIPGFGSRPIHNRLGYFQVFKKRLNFKSTQSRVQRITHQARYNHWVKSQQTFPKNPTMLFKNPNAVFQKPYISPLTRNHVGKFNRMTNGGDINGLSSSPSTFSYKSNTVRHSMRACLNPSIQKEIELLMSSTLPLIEDEDLKEFRPSAHGTIQSTHERFSLYF